ncbi:hypothetical protein SAMN05444392_103148 [Seinonella peptonophila]|uniref:Nudix hydrolase domain-containing protein n=1 Tax=Seinonella peptonophila TaxID=112248 RepID=A0A1M4WCA5_9BACL|nr:hypothetical protein [Seinonella peptonophila]SHE78805.1 hypothetical protein SAMN05444392_103148 [Seinonella peptonophila]
MVVEIHHVDHPIQVNLETSVSGYQADEKQVYGYWDQLKKSNPYIFDGIVYQVLGFQERDQLLTFQVAPTRYAQFVYRGQVLKKPTNIAYTSAITQTKDRQFLFGVMGDGAIRPAMIQCVGGALDEQDLLDGQLSLEHGMKREWEEEMGFSINDQKMVRTWSLAYLKTKGKKDNYGFIYRVELNMNAKEVDQYYQKYKIQLKERGELPEFDRLIFVPANHQKAEQMLATHQNQWNENIKRLIELELMRN